MSFTRRLYQLLVISYPVFWLGIGKQYPFSLLGPKGKFAGMLFWGLITLIWFGSLFIIKYEIPDRIINIIGKFYILLSIIFFYCFDLLNWKYFSRFGYPFPGNLLIIDSIILLIFIYYFFSYKNQKPLHLLILSGSASIIHRFATILTFPLVAARSNMFAVILTSLSNLFNGGMAYSFDINGNPTIPYLPMTILGYIPSYFLKIDPRFNALFYFIIIAIICITFHKKIQQQNREAEPLPILISLWFLNPLLAFRHELYLDFFWLIILIATIAALYQKKVLTAITGGIAIATLQFAWVLSPFWILLSTRDKKWKEIIMTSSLLLIIGGSILSVFYFKEGKYFLTSIFEFSGSNNISNNFAGDLCFGLAGLFYLLNIEKLIFKFQVITVLIMGFISLYLARKAIPDKGPILIALMIFTYFIFISTNHFIENYFYFAPLLLAGILDYKAVRK